MKVTILLALIGVGLALPTGDKSGGPKPKPIEPTKPGGYSRANVNAEDVQEMALFVASYKNKDTNSVAYSLGTVVSAEKQVVAGVNYKLTLTFNRSDGDVEQCEVIVFDQPWTNTRRVTTIGCVL